MVVELERDISDVVTQSHAPPSFCFSTNTRVGSVAYVYMFCICMCVKSVCRVLRNIVMIVVVSVVVWDEKQMEIKTILYKIVCFCFPYYC